MTIAMLINNVIKATKQQSKTSSNKILFAIPLLYITIKLLKGNDEK